MHGRLASTTLVTPLCRVDSGQDIIGMSTQDQQLVHSLTTQRGSSRSPGKSRLKTWALCSHQQGSKLEGIEAIEHFEACPITVRGSLFDIWVLFAPVTGEKDTFLSYRTGTPALSPISALPKSVLSTEVALKFAGLMVTTFESKTHFPLYTKGLH
jgi:hypothetical protein